VFPLAGVVDPAVQPGSARRTPGRPAPAAGSLKFGHASTSLLVRKLSASGRQNAPAAALKECGALRRTIYGAQSQAD